MAYTDKELKRASNIPVPQYFNPTTDDWEVLYGRNNASRVELYDSDGNPLLISSGKMTVRASELETLIGEVQDTPTTNTLLSRLKAIADALAAEVKNSELLTKQTITWNGTDLTSNVEVPVATGDVLLYINNTADQELTVTLEFEVETDVWIPYIAGDGTAISFTVSATSGKGVFGVFQKFPKYLGGRVVLTAGSAPTADGITYVQVQEV